MRKPLAKIAIFLIAFLVPLFITFCFNPLSFLDSDDVRSSTGSGSVMVVLDSSSAPAGRTVTADVPSGISLWSVSLARADGTGSVRSSSGASSSLGVDGLVPGGWNISATGANSSGVVVLSGTVSGVEIVAGKTTAVTVPLSFAPTGMGGFSLTVSFSAATGIDWAAASIAGSPLAPVVNLATDPRTATFAASNLTIGSYSLSFTLRRGGSGGTVAGSFVEAVTIYPGLVSDRWISADGSLASVWNLPVSALFSANAYLASLTASTGSLSFSSGNFAPTLISDSTAVSFVATASVDGQLIEYSTDNATWVTVQSGASTPAVPVSGSYYIRVKSPDRANAHTYVVGLTRAFTVTYGANNATAMTYGVSVNAGAAHMVLALGDTGFATPQQDGITLRFGGWNTARDGSGTQYAAGASINPVSSNLALYARWSVIGGVGPAAGYVFYDKGSYASGWRYLEVYNPSVADSVQDFFGSSGTSLGTASGAGSGKKNTALFLAKSNSGIPALCAAFVANGFGDWFIPSSAELEQIRVSLVVGCGLGGFATDNDYATSTEADINNIVAENMGNGVTANRPKTGSAMYWRPVRAFAGTSATCIVVYDVNGGTGSVASSGVSFYPAGTSAAVAGLSRGTDIFTGWNTAAGGLGLPYGGVGPAAIILADDAILYAQWRVPGVQDIINIILVGGSVAPPGTFTASDLVTIGAAIAASTGAPIQLNLSALTVATLPAGTFTGCTLLTSVTLPNSVTTILNSCFIGCTGLTTVTLGNAVTTIATSAFNGCTSLNTISLPPTVTTIGNNAFSGTALVTTGGTLTCAATTPPAIGTNVFGSSPPGSFFIKVPSANVATYQAAADWINYSTHISGY